MFQGIYYVRIFVRAEENVTNRYDDQKMTISQISGHFNCRAPVEHTYHVDCWPCIVWSVIDYALTFILVMVDYLNSIELLALTHCFVLFSYYMFCVSLVVHYFTWFCLILF